MRESLVIEPTTAKEFTFVARDRSMLTDLVCFNAHRLSLR
jgi:hypothetical protein